MENEIKCHFCGGVAFIKRRDIVLDDEKITIKDEPYYECKKCKEQFCTSEQMFALDKRLHENFTFKRNIIVAGKSLAITIPSDIDLREKVFRKAVENDFVILEMSISSTNLEDVFRKLTLVQNQGGGSK